MSDSSRERMQLMRARNALLRDTAAQEERKREYLERQRARWRDHSPTAPGYTLLKTVTLEPWHRDADGCLARTRGTVGEGADA